MDNRQLADGLRRRVEEAASENTLEGEPREVNKEDMRSNAVLYGVEDAPPWYTCILLGLQHWLTMVGGAIGMPLIAISSMCIADDDLARSEIICTQIFVVGITTLLQSTFGTRLPIVQGPSPSFFAPIFAILALEKWKCPDVPGIFTGLAVDELPLGTNQTYFEWRRGVWQERMREIQGSLCMAAILQVLVGLTGLVGFLLRFIGPLSVSTVICLIGLSLYQIAPDNASGDWGFAMLTTFLIILFSQYMRNVLVPLPAYQKGKGCTTYKAPLFVLFPVFFSIVIVWAFCGVLTVSGVLPKYSNETHYRARTDIGNLVIERAAWFRFPYPGQWGLPTFSAAAVLGMMAGVVAGILESIGDYYACARLAHAPAIPAHALNRGVMFEGIGIIIAGVCGAGTGVTSYSENVGTIAITKVASRRVVQTLGVILILFGMVGKLGAFFVTIPTPILGGLFMVVFGMITAVGMSNLQFVDLNSSRNLFVFGFSVFFGFSLPAWLSRNRGAISTGNGTADQVIEVLLGTQMFVGGVLAIFLDNTIPGTLKERGITKWTHGNKTNNQELENRIYGFPFGMKYLKETSWAKYIPICPPFNPSVVKRGECDEENLNKAEKPSKIGGRLYNRKHYGPENRQLNLRSQSNDINNVTKL